MMAVLMLLAYLAAGILIITWLLPRQPLPVRAWLGACLGLFLMMWLPALIAFLRPFDALTQGLSLLALAGLTALARRFRSPDRPAGFSGQDRQTLKLLACVALPLTLLGLYLQHTHILRPQDGALHTGQSTYGDLPLHLAIITSLPGRTLPVDYSILPGVRLGYPFLGDSLSASLLVLGLPLRAAVIVPGVLMMGLVFSGFALLAQRACRSRRAAALATLLVFLNGGLGFLYAFDLAGASLGDPGSNQLQQGVWLERLQNILQGWYQTPANHAEFQQYNLRWSNLIADMLLPQRTFLAGWTILLPCLYLLVDLQKSQQKDLRQIQLLGLLAGGLPLIHTHSFLALGLLSAGMLALDLLRRQPVKPWLLYGGLAVLLALPQLLLFTFEQTSSGNFIRFQFNWVNNLYGRGLLDGYLWFYIKNIGLPFLLALFALLEKDAWHRKLFSGALMIVLVAELILFQPNEYDNNKLFYVAWALCAMPAADYAFVLYDRLRGLRARPLMAGLAVLAMFLSGALALAREAVSDLQMFSREDVRLADYIREETAPDARFITGTQHLNPVSSLAGREIVVGPDLWLYFHGFDTSQRQDDLLAFYRDPAAARQVPARYGADYILLGGYEREMGGRREELAELFELVYEQDGYLIFKVPQG
ncbi:MAG TPA: hypothetical protein PLO90_07400 [Clostridia bacterium]|jgi:hypothetical protein|nr:hypothetical protein [Clostridia bacterium]HPY44170.1 hypothetical protein [Clostridia bacterium]HQA97453.1 hypothetical protein [Clostridia bacterium]HQO56833.1 hypothetical protein [Clostridia bacterium]